MSGSVAPPLSHLHTGVTTGDLAPFDWYLTTWGGVKLSVAPETRHERTVCLPSQMPETWRAWHVRCNTAICALITPSSRVVISPDRLTSVWKLHAAPRQSVAVHLWVVSMWKCNHIKSCKWTQRCLTPSLLFDHVSKNSENSLFFSALTYANMHRHGNSCL